jgi:signal transduction histidine kinase
MNQIALFHKFFKHYQNWFCVNRDGTILEVGDNFHSILSEAEVGSNIKELFPQEKNSNTFDFLNNNAEANEKVLRISIDDNRSLKCSWFREDEIFLVVFNPVLNSRNSLKAYNLYHSDFLPQDQILEYSFLLETTNASAADAQRLIQNLSKSRKEISNTKTFYEKILSELPVEMGVFDTEQRYLFVNKTGINDPEMRSFMIGKTDFDYCKKRGVDKSFAINRKEKFDEAMRTKQKVDWIDDFQNTRTGKRSVVRRTYFPITDDENTISVVIGYGVDITEEVKKENEILAINRSLEETVQNEIRKNLTLTSSISKQEKFSVIGEIAAGISHDLRTPLTTMKLGANNIELIIQEIFRILTTELNQQDVQLAFDAYQNLINEELFVGGMQLLKDKKNLLEFLAQKYPEYSETELSKLANSFSKARLTLQKSNLIEEIMNTAQPLNISELIFNLKAIMLFNEGISQSAEKSLAVIGNLNSFIKSEEAEKGTVNLSESILNALDVLKYVTPENITIDNELDNNIELEAYPSQLFQIWLNIIRNAIEAIGEKEDGKISILTTHDETYGIIRITNNGPKVPDDVVDNIFNQFYTTKSSQGGSGLGLSVVKKVVESHYGQIELINKDNSVTFVIRLKSKHD